MGKGKVALMILVVSAIVAFFVLPASAADAWYTCDVIQAGTGGASYVLILLQDSNKTFKKWFRAREGQENRMLATALSALSNNMQVLVLTDPNQPTADQRIIWTMYITK